MRERRTLDAEKVEELREDNAQTRAHSLESLNDRAIQEIRYLVNAANKQSVPPADVDLTMSTLFFIREYCDNWTDEPAYDVVLGMLRGLADGKPLTDADTKNQFAIRKRYV